MNAHEHLLRIRDDGISRYLRPEFHVECIELACPTFAPGSGFVRRLELSEVKVTLVTGEVIVSKELTWLNERMRLLPEREAKMLERYVEWRRRAVD